MEKSIGSETRDGLLPESTDAFEGPVMTSQLAGVYAIVEKAKKRSLCSTICWDEISGVTAPSQRLDPALDKLLQDPRFQAVMEKHEKKS